MSTTTQTTETAVNDRKPKNGQKPAETAPKGETAPTDASADTEETKEKARRGIVPTMPMAILYRLAGRVHAVVHNPIDGTSYTETGKGEGSAKGAMEDSGFRFSSMSLDAPAWLTEKLPEGANLIGYAGIKSFPLPKQ